MSTDRIRLGLVVAALRIDRKMSQAELGSLIGVSQGTVSKIEAGVQAIRLADLIELLMTTDRHITMRLEGGEMEFGPTKLTNSTVFAFPEFQDEQSFV